MEREIINKVAQSPLVTLNLEDLYDHGERVLYDLKDNLFKGLILKEKEFRAFLKSNDWSGFKDKHVAIYCSTDAIIPRWAFMLLAVFFEPYAKTIVYGDFTVMENYLLNIAMSKIDLLNYKDKKVIIKGCSKYNIPQFAYVELTRILKPYAASIMYGEPCSTVPIYKQPKRIAKDV